MSGALIAHISWATLGVALTASLLVILNDHRFLAAALGAQYALAAWLVVGALGVGTAVAQAVGGIVVTGIVWLSWRETSDIAAPPESGQDLMSLTSFRWVSVLLVLFAAWGLGRRAWMGLPGLSETASLGATFLMLLGLLQASLFRIPMRVVLGLLTLLSGFGIAYAAIESSLAVITLLIVVHLGLALAGGYLTVLRPAGAEGSDIA